MNQLKATIHSFKYGGGFIMLWNLFELFEEAGDFTKNVPALARKFKKVGETVSVYQSSHPLDLNLIERGSLTPAFKGYSSAEFRCIPVLTRLNQTTGSIPAHLLNVIAG